jgi:hypothetical protein
LLDFAAVCFRRLLVLGDEEQCTATPIRPEWQDVLESFSIPEWDRHNRHLQYTFRLRGWPFHFKYRVVIFHSERQVALGIYPNQILGWEPYRAFLVGPGYRNYRIWAEGIDSRHLPWYREYVDGWPQRLAVVDNRDDGLGCLIELPQSEAPLPASADLYVGFDFGTTNSLVYFADRDDLPGDLRAEKSAVSPSMLFSVAGTLLQGSTSAIDTMPDGWFLPSRDTSQAFRDPFIIPSAFWNGGDFPVLRWSEKQPKRNLSIE